MIENNKIEVALRALKHTPKVNMEVELELHQSILNLCAKNEKLKRINQKLEAAVEEKASELKGLFENIADAYVMMSISGNVLKINPMALTLLDFEDKKEVSNLMSFVQPEDRERTLKAFKKLYHEGILTHFIVPITTKKGKRKIVDINASMVYDKQNHPIAVQGIARDITHLKQLEKQKEELLQQLEKSNEQLEEYAHVVSHDLKSPLRTIDALIYWIKEDNAKHFNEKTHSYFNKIDTTLQKMEGLITAILKHSQISEVNANLHFIDLNITLKEVLKILNVPKHISVTIENTLPILEGDETRFHQLFQNLIGNAIQFNDKKKGEIRIRYKEKKHYHEFEIQDNGIGIRKAYQKKVFQLFETLSNDKKGTGIGLSIVKKIISLHQGKITLHSTPKVGTTFCFTLKKIP